MKPEDAQQDRKAQKIFGRAVEMTTAEARRAYLEGACDGDERLKARVEALLAHHVEDDFLQHSAAALGPGATAGMAVVTEKAGDRIGRYKLLQQIGEGGCGIVYVAEQEEPVRRRVALKVIKLGMDTRNVIARFEAERQALALMDHPNIAKVLDVGATETGRPYFVMELIRGTKLTDYCDQHNLSTRERLDLFIGVCHAIQHAHQKGIIHRDIKPSNILVTLHDSVPVPKVIDFGIAKATSEQRLTDKTVYTAFEQFIGTPAYMSPEQAEMSELDIDTRSDVYALGVLLYELLTGRTPFDAKTLLASGLNEMRRIIREQEPMPPSTRLHALTAEELTTTAQHRHAEPPKLIGLLRGDLDWIVMKCLEKDRTRRYETANGLAGDLERHLNLELVTARPPSTAYRVQKFVRRNKLVVTAGTAVAATLVMGVIGSTWFAVQENQQRKRAQESAVREKAQRERAEASEEAARQALEAEANQRRAAEEARRKARLHAYASDIQLAQSTLERGDFGRIRALLDRHIPEAGEPDLRGWEWRFLRGLVLPDNTRTVGTHTGEVTAVAFLPDGRLLTGTRESGQLALWDFETGRLLDQITARGEVSDLAIHPGGQSFAVCFGQTNVDLYSVSPLEHARTLPCEERMVDLDFSRDGKYLAATGDYFGTAYETHTVIWDFERSSVFKLFKGAGLNIAFSPIGDDLVDGDRYTVGLSSLEGGEREELYRGPGTFLGFTCVAFSPDGSTLAVGGSEEGQLTLVDLDQPASTVLAQYGQELRCVAFSPNGELLAAADKGASIHFWNVTERKERFSFRGHDGHINAMAFSADGKFLVTGGQDKTCRVWDLSRAPRKEGFVKRVPAVFGCASIDGRFLLTIDKVWSHDEYDDFLAASLWDLRRFHKVRSFEYPERMRVDSVPTLSPRGDAAVIRGKDGAILVWDLEHDQVNTFAAAGTNAVKEPVFSRDGKLLAVKTKSGAISVYDVTSQEVTSTLHSKAISSDFCPWLFDHEGKRLFVGDQETLAVFDLESGQLAEGTSGPLMVRTHVDAHPVPCIGLSDDGRTLATVSRERRVTLWNAHTLEWLHDFPGDTGWWQRPTFSGEHNRLFYFDQGGISVLDYETATQLALFDTGCLNLLLQCEPETGTLAMSCRPTDGADWFYQVWSPPSFAEIEAAEAGSTSLSGQLLGPPKSRPTRSSWLNAVERWFGEITDMRITAPSISSSIEQRWPIIHCDVRRGQPALDNQAGREER